MRITLLYRGPLASCNYSCEYCPFAKQVDSPEELRHDEGCLERFCEWVAQRAEIGFSILFVPWGEALVRPWYPRALTRLSHLGNVQRVAIQTNLSGGMGWLSDACPETLALWTTFHPSQATGREFLARCGRVLEAGIRLSVGTVGRPEHLEAIEWLREKLPEEVYLWVNAFRAASPLPPGARSRILAVDPLFPCNEHPQPSQGRACDTGESVFLVDGSGALRRCNLVGEVLGNLYRPGDLERTARPRPCPRETCRCHIGYVHMPHLGLRERFGTGLLERIPEGWPWDAR